MPHHIMILGFKMNTWQGLHSLVVTFITTLRKRLQLILVLTTMISAQALIRDTEQLITLTQPQPKGKFLENIFPDLLKFYMADGFYLFKLLNMLKQVPAETLKAQTSINPKALKSQV